MHTVKPLFKRICTLIYLPFQSLNFQIISQYMTKHRVHRSKSIQVRVWHHEMSEATTFQGLIPAQYVINLQLKAS